MLCSANQFSNNKTSHVKFLAIDEDEKGLNPNKILVELANIGITSLLIEGGPTIIKSFYKENLIDDIYLYTSPNSIDGANLKTPIEFNSDWDRRDQLNLGEDKLTIFQKKEVECLVE